MPEEQANTSAETKFTATLGIKVIRADGTVEDHGEVGVHEEMTPEEAQARYGALGGFTDWLKQVVGNQRKERQSGKP